MTAPEPAQGPSEPIPLAEALAIQLGRAWTEYLHATEVAEAVGAVSVMLAGRILRLQSQLQDLTVPEPPLPLLLGLEEPEADDEGAPGGATIQ